MCWFAVDFPWVFFFYEMKMFSLSRKIVQHLIKMCGSNWIDDAPTIRNAFQSYIFFLLTVCALKDRKTTVVTPMCEWFPKRIIWNLSTFLMKRCCWMRFFSFIPPFHLMKCGWHWVSADETMRKYKRNFKSLWLQCINDEMKHYHTCCLHLISAQLQLIYICHSSHWT